MNNGPAKYYLVLFLVTCLCLPSFSQIKRKKKESWEEMKKNDSIQKALNSMMCDQFEKLLDADTLNGNADSIKLFKNSLSELKKKGADMNCECFEKTVSEVNIVLSARNIGRNILGRTWAAFRHTRYYPKGDNVVTQETQKGLVPVYMASYHRNQQLLEFLLGLKADINKGSSLANYISPIEEAIFGSEKNKPMDTLWAEVLLKNKAEIKYVHACTQNEAMIGYLVRKGWDKWMYKEKCAFGNPAFLRFAYKNGLMQNKEIPDIDDISLEELKILAENKYVFSGQELYHFVVFGKKEMHEKTKIVCSSIKDIDKSKLEMTNALSKAVEDKDLEMVKIIVEAGANVNYQLRYTTILEEAKRIGDQKIIDYLVSKGAVR